MALELDDPVAVTLPLGAWNTVLGCIAKAPWDVADPLIQELRKQLMGAQARAERHQFMERQTAVGADQQLRQSGLTEVP